MRNTFIAVTALILSGCTTMTNLEVIEIKKICEENGMRTQVIQNLISYEITKVNCLPTLDNE